MRSIILIASIFMCSVIIGQAQLKTDDIYVKFVSEAPLELISAETESCTGILDPSNLNFAFRVKIRSFEGFNSPLQREHFNENYMESDKFPYAVFQGRFLDELNPDESVQRDVRVKGVLNIHGVEDERVLSLRVKVDKDKSISFEGDFDVVLDDHDIEVPRIVYQKIAETISIHVKGVFH
jgi:polyisoprenoid-binding protein YceI